MKIGVVVDGQAEFHSLKLVYDKIKTDATLLKPLYADMQPNASPAKIVKAAQTPIRALLKKKVDRVVVCLDYENRTNCLVEWVNDLEKEFIDAFKSLGIDDIHIVLKVRMYENWLVSDLNALKRMSSRFSISKAHERLVEPNRSDQSDAMKILKSAVRKKDYDKVKDAISIMRIFDPYLAAKNSRSFRKFLRAVECQTYCTQSKNPM